MMHYFGRLLRYNRDYIYIYNKESGDSYAECLRYARFNGPSPFVLNIGDYNVLVNSNCIFARKFGTSLPEEKELVDKIFDMYK